MANECKNTYDYNVAMNEVIVETTTRNWGGLASAKYSQASLVDLFNQIHNQIKGTAKIPTNEAVQKIVNFTFAFLRHNKVNIKDADTLAKDVIAQIQSAFNPKQEEKTDGTTPIQLEDKNDTVIQLRTLSLKQRFAELYGANANVKDRLSTNLQENIVEVLYYNLTKPNRDKDGNLINYGYLVTGNGLAQFNRNIYDLQSKYFKYLVDYIIDNNLGTAELRSKILGKPLYDANGFLNSNVYDVLHTVEDYIKNNTQHSSFISQGYAEESLKGQSFQQTTGTSPSYRYYKMVESFYCLSHFDDLISETIGNIHVSSVLKNNFSITNKVIKYKTALDKQGRYTGFSMDEMRNGFSEAGRFSKTILNTLPMYKYLGSRLEGAHIEYPTVIDAFAVLKRAVLQSVITSTENKETSNYRFIKAVLNIIDDPKGNIYTILSILFDENPNILDTLRKDTSLQFSDEMINTLYSLWKFVYNPNPEGHTSFMELENRQLFGNSINRNSSYSLLDCISGLILRVASMHYINTSFDDDGMNVQVRSKFNNSRAIMDQRDTVNFRLQNASLSQRQDLVKKYSINVEGGSLRIRINNRISLKIDPASDKRLLLDHTRNQVYILIDNNVTDIDEWFKNSDIDLLSYDPSAISTHVLNQKNEQDFKDVLQFIQDVLGIETLTTQGLNTLYIYSNNFTTMMTDLVDGAARFAIANEAYLKYLNAPDSKPSLPEFLIQNYPDIYRVVGTISNGRLDLTKSFYHYVQEFGEGNYRMVAGHKSLKWLDGYTAAQLQLTGGKKKMTTLNFSGKQEQAGRTDFLGNELQHQILKIRKDRDDTNDEIDSKVNKVAEKLNSLTNDIDAYKKAVQDLGIEFIPESVSNTVERYRQVLESQTRRVATANILFAKNHKLLSNVVAQTDVKSPTQRVKQIKQMNEGELLINAIFQQFWGCQSSTDSQLAQNFIIQPTTYSDKTFILTYLINGGSFKIDGKTYNLQDLTHEQTVQLIKNTVGGFYQDLAHNIILDWNRIFAQAKRNDASFIFDKPCESIIDVNKVLLTNNFDKYKYINIAQRLGIEVFEDLYIVKRKDGRLQANELLQYYITTFTDEGLLSKFLNDQKLLFINDLLKQNYILDIEDEVIAPAVHANSGIKEDWSHNGVLILGKIKDASGNVVKEVINQVSVSLNPGEVLELNPIFEKYYNSFNVVASNLRLLATGTELVHPYVSKNSSQLTSLSQNEVKRLANVMHTEFYNWLDFRDKLEQNKAVLSPSDYTKGLQLYENAMLQFAGITGAQGASLKRNVIIPGTLQVIQQKILTAPLPKIKIAIIDDVKAYVNQINGRKKVIDANDGSAFKSPQQNIMENRSLQDQEVGWDTKFISQGYNTQAGVPQLQKFAAYAITNTRMKQSMMSTTSLHNLYKKMHNIQWRDKSGKWTNSKGITIDLVDGKRYGYSNYDPKKSYEENIKKGKDGENPAVPDTKVNFTSDILEHSRLFYGLGEQHTEILDLGKTTIGSKTFANCEVVNDNGTTTIKLNDKQTITIKPVGKSGKYVASINKTEGLYCAMIAEGYFIANRDSQYYIGVNGQDVTVTAINDTAGIVPRTMLYYTSEQEVDASGNVSKGTKIVKKYHLFDDDGNHQIFEINRSEDVLNILNLRRSKGLHTINSLYELHESLGGVFCEELQDDKLVASEKNHFCVTNYMNIISGQRTQLYKSNKVYNQDDYYQPLKEMYIGYATNKSAFKCGVGNLNPSTSWNDSTPLTYIQTDSDILGAQGDFDHKADEAMMSTPTQVMTALAQGGNVHHVVDQIYRTVGLASLKSVEKELEVFKSQDSNRIYELVGRIVIQHLSSNSDSLDIAEDIIRQVEKEFNLNLSNHERDSIMLPFSDPSIYGHLVPTIINIINKKAIKVKNPGLGMVMVPSFGIMQTWQINGQVYTAQDLIDKVASTSNPANLKQNIQAFLQQEQDKIEFQDKAHLFYDLGSIINVKVNDIVVPVNINSLDAFVAFDDADWLFFSKYKDELKPYEAELKSDGLVSVLNKLADGVRAKILSDLTDSCFLYQPGELQYQENITIGKDLLPNRIDMDVEITEPDGKTSVVKKSFYSIPKVKQAIKSGNELSRKEVNEILHDIKLNEGYIDERGVKQRILRHTYHKSQTIVSNMWSKEYGVSYRDPLLKVKTQRLFKSEDIDLDSTLPNLDTINFIKSDNQHTHITFSQINKSLETEAVKYYQYQFNNLSVQESNDGVRYVYQLDSDGDAQFITGIVVETTMDPIKDRQKIVKDKKLLVDNGKVYKYIQFVDQYTAAINHAQAQTVFSINEKAINEAIADVKLFNPKASISFKSVLSQLIKQLYQQDQYIGVTTSGEPIKGDNANLIIESVQSLTDIQPNLTYLNSQKGHKYLTATQEEKNRLIKAFLKDEEQRVRVSFYKTLEVISSRIPAQTLQSFMSMEVVGYAQMDTNVAYVTSLQTFLQGSDYDIDKAYMLTYFFDSNGKFIGWSPLFSLKSEEALDASIKLPYPEDIYIGIVSSTTDKNGNLNTNLYGFGNALKYNLDPDRYDRVQENTKDVKKLLDTIKQLESVGSDEAAIIEKYAELLELMYRFKTTVGERDILYLSLTAQEVTDYSKILQKLNQHQHYQVPKHLEQQALQNSYTSKIHLVATDLDNVNSANTAITMEDAQETTKLTSSVDGWRNLFNPATVYHMQDENLGGKVVISVAANGEKGYFTLYQYYTSMYHILRDNPDNKELLNLLRFQKTFDRIQGRWDEVFGKGKMRSKTVKQIGNLNQKLIDSLKSKNYLTDEEIEHEVDQMISQLLSAATDNAKELILSKINADMDYARMYFYLLTLGFTLDDIAAFMTSPAATMIIQQSKKNIFFKSQQSNSPEKAIKLFTDYNVNLHDFLQQNCISKIERFIPYQQEFRKDRFTSISQYIEAYVKGRFKEKPSEFFAKFLGISDPDQGEFAIQINGDIQKQLQQLDMYVEGLKNKRDSALQIYEEYGYNNPEEQLEADIKEFKNVYLGATELSDLVQVFLSSNQGLPTTADKLFNALDNMSKIIKNREVEMTVDGMPLSRQSKITKELLMKGIQSIQTDPNLKEESYLSPIVDRVMEEHLYNNFNLERWFIDPEYRKLVIDYYNVIKHTFNIYHVIDSHPSYRVNIQELYPMALGLIRSSASKFNLVKALRDRWKALNNNYFNSRDLSKITSVANKIIIRKFLEAFHIQVPKAQDWKVLKGYLERDGVSTESVTLNDGDGYSTFKYIMEEYIIPGLKAGQYPFIDQDKFGSAVQNNAFIKGLIPFERDNVPFYKLDIDLNANGNTVYNDIKYNEFIKGFKALADIPVANFTDIYGNQYSLQDLFILYNIIVHQNQYGADTLTSLFKSVLTRKDTKSLLYKLEGFIGEFDKRHTVLSKAEIVQYDLDLAEKISPITSVFGERRQQAAYVRTNEHNILILKEKKKGGYVPAPIFDVKADSNNQGIKRMQNYVRYGTISSPGRDGSQVLANSLKSSNPEEVANALKQLIQMGKVVILVNC